MSKSIDYTFYKSKELYDWGGNVISRNLCDKLQVGDIVRLCLCFPNDSWFKYYFEITKINYYKYGDTSKIRKFHGKVRDTYVMNNWYVIGPDHTTTFRKEDIFEIPFWKTNYNPLTPQPNYDIITQEIKEKRIKDVRRENNEYELALQKRKLELQKRKKKKN